MSGENLMIIVILKYEVEHYSWNLTKSESSVRRSKNTRCFFIITADTYTTGQRFYSTPILPYF